MAQYNAGDDVNEVVQEEDDPLLGTSTLRGILLLGGVGVVAYIAYTFWQNQRNKEAATPQRTKIIRVPIELPITKPKVKK